MSFCKLQEDEESVIPSFLPLSSEHISDDGVYLLENGHDCLIYVGDSVSLDIVRKLFGVSTVDEIPTLVISMLIFLSLSLQPLVACHCLKMQNLSNLGLGPFYN
jgi:hypothetical protein